MIKIKAAICGTITTDAVITTNEKGVSNLEFTMKVLLPSRSDDHLNLNIPVIVNDDDHSHIKDYVKGNRIVMDGKLCISKADEEYVFVLRDAQPQITYGVPAEDNIKGDLSFTGRVKDVVEKTDKRGLPYLVVSASSPVKTGKQWERIWFHFKRFPKKGEGIEQIRPSELIPGVDVEVLGDVQMSSYNNRINLSSRVIELEVKDINNGSEDE